jgi:hypothetical protein
MKIIIIGKSNQMGSTPNIRLKGMSQLRYNFLWDPEIRHFAYEPKNQKEVDDIFRTQGRIYKTMYFSVYMDEPKPEPEPEVKPSSGSKSRPTAKPKKKSNSQPVAEADISE